MPLLFLSHAAVDSEAAVTLARRIEESPTAKERQLKVWQAEMSSAQEIGGSTHCRPHLSAPRPSPCMSGLVAVVQSSWSEVSVALDKAHKDAGYPLIPILAPGVSGDQLPSFLSQFQGVVDPARDEAQFEMLLRAVLGLEPRAAVTAEHDPFVGLQAFDGSKAHLFFGRDDEIKDLVVLLRDEHLVMVVGDSGSGKSSLVRAGLVPAFKGGQLVRPREAGPDNTIWYVIETRPGTDPFARLADSVRETAERTGAPPKIASELADLVRTKQPEKVRDAVLWGAPSDPHTPTKTLIVVDQFEEFRTSPDAADFVAALLRLAEPGDDRIRVVLTMRRDYYYLTASFGPLYKRLETNQRRARYLLHRPPKEKLRLCIVSPLRLAAVPEAERDALAAAVLKDVGDEPGEVALLQMALWRTWTQRKAHGDLLRSYNAIGRVEGALAQAAEEVFDQRLSDEERARCEPLFVRLVRPGEAGGATRRVAALAEFDEPTRELARRLAEEKYSRLLTIGEDRVELTHEALATQWLRYQRWIANTPNDPRGDDLRLLQLLSAAAVRWGQASHEAGTNS